MNKKPIVLRAVIAAALAMSQAWLAPPSTYAKASHVRIPIRFTMPAGRCPNLEVGVEGSGDSFIVTNTRVDKDGVQHMIVNNLVTGTATDSEGETYGFNYHNHASFAIPPTGFPFHVALSDHFNLNGQGKANHLHVRFVARVTFISPSDPPLIELISEGGNPFLCDAI